MENMHNNMKIRKIRKIKRSHPLQNAPMTFGAPIKVNYGEEEKEQSEQLLLNGEIYSSNNEDAENIKFVADGDLLINSASLKQLLHNKTIMLMMFISVIIGMILAYVTLPQQKAPLDECLTHVVKNTDVPKGKSRCGVAEPHQGCVLYIMNPMNKEVRGRDFYINAAKWTGRERYSIETGNMHYGNTVIKPGYFAEINVPPIN